MSKAVIKQLRSNGKTISRIKKNKKLLRRANHFSRLAIIDYLNLKEVFKKIEKDRLGPWQHAMMGIPTPRIMLFAQLLCSFLEKFFKSVLSSHQDIEPLMAKNRNKGHNLRFWWSHIPDYLEFKTVNNEPKLLSIRETLVRYLDIEPENDWLDLDYALLRYEEVFSKNAVVKNFSIEFEITKIAEFLKETANIAFRFWSILKYPDRGVPQKVRLTAIKFDLDETKTLMTNLEEADRFSIANKRPKGKKK